MNAQVQPTDACQRPGCGGAYDDVGDGERYCDTCGMAPAAVPEPTPDPDGTPPPSVPSPPSAPSAPSGPSATGAAHPSLTDTSCQRRGCGGAYEDLGDGALYCDTCGLAPVVGESTPSVPSTPVPAAPTAGTAGTTGTTGTTGTVTCHRSGCTGRYQDMGDGEQYCDTCGLALNAPEQPTPATPSPATPTAAPAAVCHRSGCTGRYQDMGDGEQYCDTCGLALNAPEQPTPVTPSPAALAAAASVRSVTVTPGTSRSQMSRRSVSGRLSRTAERRLSGPTVSVRSAGAGATARRARLGAGLVAVPEVPAPDPESVVLDDPEVPERKRFCSTSGCGAAVGRSRDDQPGRTEGFCSSCGRWYSFVPKLRPGDMVHGQYEVAGCLAHGGLGWIYLAVDRAVADRWVVLKGLLDTGDEDAMAAAISERRFLAKIEHSTIVRIYNFVEHLDQRTGSLDGYIVMEYVGGKSLKDLATERRGSDGRRVPLPVAQACAYGIEALDALGHLHSRNLLYCDFKVDNAIQRGDQLKLIDLGAVRRMEDEESAIYGTVGYQAPEVAEDGPSVASDLYTVARTLAVLTFDFPGYTTVHAHSLPDPEHVEVFRRYESFYRLLTRATDPDPTRRFASAEEMSEQLTGVLREIVAVQTGQPQPALSSLFGPEPRVVDTELLPVETSVSALGKRDPRRRNRTDEGTDGAVPLPPATPPSAPPVVPLNVREAALALPAPRVDPADPNAGFLAGLTASAPSDLLAALQSAPTQSVERKLRELRAHLELTGVPSLAEDQRRRAGQLLRDVEREAGDDWRVIWYRGLTALVTGDLETAALAFDAVYDAFPGEVAPKLALGLCAQTLGQLDNAVDYYELVWASDPSHVSAGFGLARVQLALGNRAGAVRALESVPDTSAHFTTARVAGIRARLRQRSPTEPLLPELQGAAQQLAELREMSEQGLEPALGEQLSCEVLGAALDWLLAGSAGRPGGQSEGRPAPADPGLLLGHRLDETGIRLGMERSCRVLARLARTREERIDLVEAANRFRPRTWV